MPTNQDKTRSVITRLKETVGLPYSSVLTAGSGIVLTYDPAAGTLTVAATGGGAAPDSAAYLLAGAVPGTLANARQLLAGTGITFDDSVAGARTINGGATSRIAFKAANTGRTAVTVLADPDLTFANVAAGSYLLELYLPWSDGGGGGHINAGIQVTPGGIGAATRVSAIGGAAAGATTHTITVGTGTGSTTLTNQGPYWITGTLISIAALSTVQLVWGQDVATGTTTVQSGAYMKLTPTA